MDGIDPDDEDWVLSTYSQDIQDAYANLLRCYPSLGSFRSPLPTDSTHIQNIYEDLRTFMICYQIQFMHFAETELERHQLSSSSSSCPVKAKRLTRMLDPLFRFSQRLKEGLKHAEEAAEQDEESLGLGSDFSFDISSSLLREADDAAERVHKAADEKTANLPFAPSALADPANHASPSKRLSDGMQPESVIKRHRPVNRLSTTTTVVSSNPAGFEPHSFSRTESASSTSTDMSTSSTSTTMTTSTITTPLTSTGDIAKLNRASSRAFTPTPSASNAVSYINVTPNPYQAIFAKYDIWFHVQWEFARMINQHETVTWTDIELSDIRSLKGTASNVLPQMENIISAVSKRKLGIVTPNDTERNKNPICMTGRRARVLAEVDYEEESIREGDLRGLGNDSLAWPYGGRLVYTVAVSPTDFKSEYTRCEIRSGAQGIINLSRALSRMSSSLSSTSSGPITSSDNPLEPSSNSVAPDVFPFKLALRAPDMPGKSYRLARRFGSRRIVVFKIKDVPLNCRERLLEMFVGRVFVVFGRSYRALWAPAGSDSIFTIETNEVVSGMSQYRKALRPELPSFEELFSRYNDLSQKPKQAMAKWAARPQILFSDSVPGARVDPSAIGIIPDLVTLDAQATGSARTEQILTDGCGLMSESLAQRIFSCRNLHFTKGRPTVIQMRIGGSKGLLALMSPSQSAAYPGKEILLRDSMVKAICASGFRDDLSLLTVDVLCCESLKIGTTLPSEAIVCMVHNGVPPSVFVKMAEDGLDSLRDAFRPRALEGEEDGDVKHRLVASCFRLGGVGLDRKKREARLKGRSAKVAGLVRRWATEDVEDEENTDPLVVGASERYDVDPISGQPGGIAEALLGAVSSGFLPATSAFSAAKLHHLLDKLSSKMTQEMKLPVEQSLSAFIVPDSLQILQPHELFIAFSCNGPIDPITHCPITHLEGEVLAFRSPCKLPTDVRKFQAVFRPELAHLKDCVVLSAHSHLCHRSPASYLGGGDYDGDTVQLFWDKELVANFTNAPDHFAETPVDFEMENFDKEIVQGTTFLDDIRDDTEDVRIAKIQRWLLSAVKGEELVGKYSDWHGNATYKFGYDHPKTIRLARMFCNVLDARKSGLHVKPDVKRLDQKEYAGEVGWRTWKKRGEDLGDSGFNPKIIKRPSSLGPFIMDILMIEGEKLAERMMGYFPSEIDPPSFEDYNDLCGMWRDFFKKSKTWHDESLEAQLEIVKRHVSACYQLRPGIVRGHIYDVGMAYGNLLADEKIVASPRKPKLRSGHASPTKRKNSAESTEENLEMLTKKRRLALIWRENPKAEDIPLIAMWGDQTLRELKLSCLSEMPNGWGKARQIAPFDMDFNGVCAMKAKAVAARSSEGFVGATTVLTDIWNGMKPSYKG
ncbi:hypothetical protein I316_06659 [Kwoniella heveanensis BCC8398]|uniref:RNA-dependent RNA polymerase n=1 Tax=Kwoniella heveanensis BCC8398 TaxID=1296120 RepID=A0A1B9GKQ9_9TREE|nr:hypothetical protein I316_06659 [Kwoniella heveanensis BCC8398]